MRDSELKREPRWRKSDRQGEGGLSLRGVQSGVGALVKFWNPGLGTYVAGCFVTIPRTVHIL